MKNIAIELAKEIRKTVTTNQEVAKKLKSEFDQQFDCTWHCLVGSDFGSFITHGI